MSTSGIRHCALRRAVRIARDQVEECDALLDLQEGLGSPEPHARSEASVELEDNRAVEELASVLVIAREITEARDLAYWLELVLRKHPRARVRQLLVVVRERPERRFRHAGIAHLLEAGLETARPDRGHRPSAAPGSLPLAARERVDDHRDCEDASGDHELDRGRQRQQVHAVGDRPDHEGTEQR